jgi:hypothetical protein
VVFSFGARRELHSFTRPERPKLLRWDNPMGLIVTSVLPLWLIRPCSTHSLSPTCRGTEAFRCERPWKKSFIRACKGLIVSITSGIVAPLKRSPSERSCPIVIKTSFLVSAHKVVFPLLLHPKETCSVSTASKTTEARLAVIESTLSLGTKILGVLVAAVLGLFGLFYFHIVPDKVELGITNSNHLNNKFAEVREDVKKLDGRFEQLLSSIRPLVSPKILAGALKESAEADLASLPAALDEIKNLLAVARDMRVPMRGKDYNEVAKPLFERYLASEPPLKQQIWSTLVDLANTRTKTDAVLHPVAAQGKTTREGDVDLSEQTVWEKTIFRNANIKISKPDQDLTLKQVRFVDSAFVAAESEASQKLLDTVLKASGPEITATVTEFKVLPPKGEVKDVVGSASTSANGVIAQAGPRNSSVKK